MTLSNLLLLLSIFNTNAFNLYKSLHPLKKTTHLFDRLRHHEVITFEHNQFHHIDDADKPIYPMNGKLEFFAFGRFYKLLIRKNVELFSDNFVIERHKFDKINNKIHKTKSFEVPQCHYTAEVASDSSNSSIARFSACRGHGIQGWIHAFGETIVIRPKLLLTNTKFNGRHRINHEHIVYKYQDLDRSDYQTDCGHDHHSHSHSDEDDKNEHTHTHSTTSHDLHSDIFGKIKRQVGIQTKTRRNLQTSSDKQHVELVVALDPGIIQEYGADEDEEPLLLKTISYIARVQAFYLNTDWGTNVPNVQIVLSNIAFIEDFNPSGLVQPFLACNYGGVLPNLYQSSPTGDYCEVSYQSYLTRWNDYRSVHFSDYDNGHLLSYFDFQDSVIGYAGIGKMCIEASSGGINQVTFDDEYNSNIIAHEMGHNFGMQHDSTGNSCPSSGYILASKGSVGAPTTEFSTCSISYLATKYSTGAFSCLENTPLTTEYAVCRNGFVEVGEVCDCGAEDCTLTGDSCCDGSTCGLYAFAKCSNDDPCCTDCQIKAAGSECRALSTSNSCDIEAEVCDGVTAECPTDTFQLEGTACDGGNGYCYNGVCKTIIGQCGPAGLAVPAQDQCGNVAPIWKVSDDGCANALQCLGIGGLSGADGCTSIDFPESGMPCDKLGTSEPAQCVDFTCQLSSDVYTYKWTTGPWDECSKSCKSDADDAVGTHNRTVSCTLQDGTLVDESKCTNAVKPITQRECNDFVCNFCAFPGICGEHGQCDDERGVCDCEGGYGGTVCNIEPSLNFTGIVSMSYKDASTGVVIVERANPCVGTNQSIVASVDSASNTQIQPVDGISTFSNLYVGSSVGIRWSTAGSVDSLAVGLVEVTPSGFYADDVWPFYVGRALASNDQCEEEDECYNDLTCNDYLFQIPTSINAGNYKLIVRFNNDYNIESDVLTIQCSDNNCNSTGHGQCNANGLGCECDEGWSGYSCEYSPCDDWEFSKCDGNDDCATTIGVGNEKPKCFSSECNAIISNFTQSDQCNINDNGCSDLHFEGDYCEIPVDYCSTLSSDSIACTDDAQCEYAYIGNNAQCVYSDCFSFTSQEDCEGFNGTANFINSTTTWSIFCEWIDDSYCNRVTCGNDILPKCENGAVRKPLYDEFSSSPQSICNGWYCDCSTVFNVEEASWTVSDKSVLLDALDSDYDIQSNANPLTAQFIDDSLLPLFTCSDCSLECQNGANDAGECKQCDIDCPIEESPFRGGIECNQVFWISHFRIDIKSDLILSKFDEFEALLTLDLAYFLGTDIKHISIWQIKPDGDKSIVYFRYLFDTNNDDETQIVGGDIMILAQKEFADSTSTATRGFIMKYTDSSYEFDFCLPNKEECDPTDAFNFNLYFIICFFASFAFETIVFIIYWFATKGRREREYEEKLAEQRRILEEMNSKQKNVTRIGFKSVKKKRAAKIAADRKEFADLQKMKNEKKVTLDADNSESEDGNMEWQTFESENTQQTEMAPFEAGNQYNKDSMYSDQQGLLPHGWEERKDENGRTYYHDKINGKTSWHKPIE